MSKKKWYNKKFEPKTVLIVDTFLATTWGYILITLTTCFMKIVGDSFLVSERNFTTKYLFFIIVVGGSVLALMFGGMFILNYLVLEIKKNYKKIK